MDATAYLGTYLEVPRSKPQLMPTSHSRVSQLHPRSKTRHAPEQAFDKTCNNVSPPKTHLLIIRTMSYYDIDAVLTDAEVFLH